MPSKKLPDIPSAPPTRGLRVSTRVEKIAHRKTEVARIVGSNLSEEEKREQIARAIGLPIKVIMDKEIRDFVEPPLPPEKPRLWMIPVTVVVTLAIVFAGLFIGGFFNSRTIPAGPTASQNTANATSATTSAECVSAVDAKNHVGKQVSVCGKVESATYAARTKGKPTFLNLDRAYPNQIFTVVVWDTDRSKFGSPENDFRGKSIRVTGKVEMFRGSAEIVVNNPSQIIIQ